MISDDAKKVLQKMEALCARKEYCSSDIYKKVLKVLDGDEEKASEVMAALVKEKYVDDLRYAGAYARDKSSLDGWGPVKIRYQLSAKGISGAVIAEALSGIDSQKADSRLRDLLAAKYRTIKGDGEERLKLLKFALSRGYEYDDADKAVKDLLSR